MSYHIDELRPQQDKLPSLVKLKEYSVGTLFEKSLRLEQGAGGIGVMDYGEPVEEMPREGQEPSLDDFADMPPLEGYTEEDYIRQGHKPGE